VRPKQITPADLYVLSAPGRIGKPIGRMRRFLKRMQLPAGTRCAVLTTEGAPKPNAQTGKMPSAEELAKWQRVTPIMRELIQARHMEIVAETKVLVTGLKGPLEEGWQKKVAAFAAEIQKVG